MSVIDDVESLERDIRELILHSKSKRCTAFEPCNEENLPKYMKSIEQELSVLGVKYLFNQYEDLNPEHLYTSVLKLANATWGLILHHKDVAANGVKLKDRNYTLQQNNFFLNDMVDKQKKQLEQYESRLRDAAEKGRQLTLRAEGAQREAGAADVEAKRARGRLTNREAEMAAQLRRAQLETQRLRERLHGTDGLIVSKHEARNNLVGEYRSKEKIYKETIGKLQENNRQLLQEVLHLKEDLLEEAAAELAAEQ